MDAGRQRVESERLLALLLIAAGAVLFNLVVLARLLLGLEEGG